MDLTRERALELHRRMWGDMQKELGDNPPKYDRYYFKRQWCEENFPNESILSECFLCEYVRQISPMALRCYKCPIKWGNNNAKFNCQGYGDNADYRYDSISKILALPERKVGE